MSYTVHEIREDVRLMEPDIATNTANIATNATDIATNATDITTNTADIATNTTDIGTKLPLAGGTLTGALFAAAGSAPLPSLSFDGDSNTGIYQYAANRIGFSADGTYRLVIDSGGLIVNGTIECPVGSAGAPSYTFNADIDTGMYRYTTNGLAFATAGVSHWHIDAAGDLWNGDGSTSIITTTPRIAFDGGSQYAIFSRAGIAMYIQKTGANGNAVRFYKNTTIAGSISINTSTTVYATSSDYRLKENLLPITGALDLLAEVQPKTFNFIADPDLRIAGYLAHEYADLCPWGVVGEKDELDEDGEPEMQSLDASTAIPLLHAAILELKDLVDAL